jgi:hypothetical protein
MSELFKPLTGTPLIASVAAATPAGAVATASAALGSLPPALADITAGTVIAGVVVERGRGMVVLKTDKGMLPLQTNLALKLGAAVVLEVQSVGAQVRLAIISVDQHAPTALSREALPLETTALAAAFEHDETTAPTSGNRAAAPPLVGRTLTATVVGPPDLHAAGTGEETIPTLLRRLIAISTVVRAASDTRTAIADEDSAAAKSDVPPQSRAERAPAAPPTVGSESKAANSDPEPLAIPSTEELEAALKTLPAPARDIVAALLDDGVLEMPAQTIGVKGGGTPQTTPADRALLTQLPSTELTTTPKSIAIRILAQSAATSGPPSLPRAQVPAHGDTIILVGTIVGDDGTDIATPIGRLRLPLPAPLPRGTQVTFEVLSRADTQRPAPQARAAESLAQMVDAERDWSAARDVATRWPEAADALLPKAGQSLGPSVLAFLAAVRGGGNLKPWAGSRFAEAADAPAKKELITRLGQDLVLQARTATSQHPEGWQTIAIPVVDAGRISELRFRFRKRGRRDGDAEDGGRRFVVEAKLSALGPLQIDGTVRERHLALVVRTAKALPPQMRRDIMDVFAHSLAETSYRGEIRFRNDGADSVPGLPAHSSGVVV